MPKLHRKPDNIYSMPEVSRNPVNNYSLLNVLRKPDNIYSMPVIQTIDNIYCMLTVLVKSDKIDFRPKMLDNPENI
jgi:hypothetical protein